MEIKTSHSKLGILCLILTVIILSLIDLRALLALGFLYYSYKLLYKKEAASRTDKILILALLVLLAIVIILEFYILANSLNSTQLSQSSV
jgi:hypothetical protein